MRRTLMMRAPSATGCFASKLGRLPNETPVRRFFDGDEPPSYVSGVIFAVDLRNDSRPTPGVEAGAAGTPSALEDAAPAVLDDGDVKVEVRERGAALDVVDDAGELFLRRAIDTFLRI